MIEDTLFQIKNLEESLKKNAQGILSSTMRKEINSLVKESLMEQEEVVNPEDPTLVEPGIEEPAMETDDDSLPGLEDPGMETGDEEMVGMEPEDETIDMRGASDAEVIRVFKAMGDNDGVVVTRDNNIITLTDDDDEYIIKLNESMENFNETAFDSSMEEGELYEFGKSEYDMYSRHFGDEEDMDFEDEEDMDFGYEDEEDMDYDYMPMNKLDMGIKEKGMLNQDPMAGRFKSNRFDDEDDMDFEDEEDESIMYEIEMEESTPMDDLAEMDYTEQSTPMDDLAEMFEDFDLDSEEDEEDMDDDYIYESEMKKRKSKGLTGNGPKFKYGKTTDYKMPRQKEGTKGVGMGKAKFTYKDGENLDGEFRPIKKGKKVETKEASRFVKPIERKVKRGLMAAPKHLKEEVVELRTKNDEYRKALDLFRTKLNEVAVFNSNLAYATRLFTEHSTTKQEKINILRRFDDVETLKESKNLYRVIKSELSTTSLTESVSLNESIERTVNKTVSSGSAVNLIESKTYENPQFLRMKDLMSKLTK